MGSGDSNGDGDLMTATISSKAAQGYAGDVTPQEAWRVLSLNEGAQLVDVRSAAEWTFVGAPDLSSLKASPIFVEWKSFPGMGRVESFASDVSQALASAGADAETPVFFLCRSGGRSASAAGALTQMGAKAAFNVAGGFEGDLNVDRHRGGVSGWKAGDLPWVQT